MPHPPIPEKQVQQVVQYYHTHADNRESVIAKALSLPLHRVRTIMNRYFQEQKRIIESL